MTGELPLEGLPRRLFRCTPSRLTTWLDCPKRYRMTYVDRPPPAKGPPWAHNSLGATVHNALKAWFTDTRRTPDAARVAVDDAWIGDGYRDETQAAQWRARARDMVADYVRGCDPVADPVGVERTVATRHGGLALHGRVDRIDVQGDELVVVDYKTGRHPLTVDDVRGSLALAIYAAATENTLRRRCRTVELHHLPTGEVHRWTYPDGAIERHLARAEVIAEEAREAETFPARPGPQCQWCDFVRVCADGRAVATPRRSWDGLG